VVCENDLPVLATDDDRLRQRLQHRRRGNGGGGGVGRAHAAALCLRLKMLAIWRSTSAGWSLLRKLLRSGLSSITPADCMYQSRCLRAARKPTATPYSISMSS